MKKKILLVIILLIILAGLFVLRVKIRDLWINLTKPKIPIAMEYQGVDDIIKFKIQDLRSKINDQPPTSSIQTNLKTEHPTSYNLDVPFTSQAPHANWDETFKEGCEEASALMIDYFYHDKIFTPDLASDEILKMVDWEMDYFGGHFDLTASQTIEMIKEYFGYKNVDVINNPTLDDIKMHISEQRPVIIPAAGRKLGNPFFKPPGPIYHMLVIKGYTETQFITNDPGTKRGEDYLYNFDVLMDAIHDWDENNIFQGEKRIIVIYPNL